MCGRFKLAPEKGQIAELLRVEESRLIPPRYNICPTQPVEIVRDNPHTRNREILPVVWGLIPTWAPDPSIGARLINARSETAADKPAFRNAFRRRRCLVPADGFYEWRRTPLPRQPFLITHCDGGLFAFAGLWEIWDGPNGEQIESCTILTTDSNELLRGIHDRMPVILHPRDYDMWLDVATEQTASLKSLLKPYPPDQLAVTPIGTRINNPANDDRSCIEPVTPPGVSFRKA